MEEADDDFGFGFEAAPCIVSLAPFTPIPLHSTRRLSSNFTEPRRPVPAARQLAWLSLEGRLVNADEASSARAIKGGLDPDVAVAWELFSPIERFLIVAVIGVAVAESKKNGQICQLKKSVELRDQVLSTMQQKLDCLCERLNSVKDQSGANADLPFHEVLGSDKTKFVDCGCWLCDEHHNLFNKLTGNSVTKASNGEEILQYKNVAEQEERRMSDLSDWASSVTSAAEFQMNNLAIEQDVYNLKRDCDEKDATIKELTTLLHSSDIAGTKRIAELEDIIRRKNMMITRLKKDMVVLEQKVVNLTRLRRPSFSESHGKQVPYMTENVLYDMDGTTSPSSSDSDSCPAERSQSTVFERPKIPAQSFDTDSTTSQKSAPAKASCSMVRTKDWHAKSQSERPLTEISMNQRSYTIPSSRQRHLSAGGESKKSRRHILSGKKDSTPHKRWV
ncbi:uncharacterized protein LOC107412625 isoform X2 [Ziziphus jujuba]|uniref:Uncharacterized protein LOC107412625 isoform X1 n=3 Tax=Ziziphus jujuba TaxID=326968 RepID=A0A6P3ZL58_ZIZJJ|nr:uncharacterized protein LOC107412625 isoform X1 [Ziziphus jujuba]XP_015875923.3 uncharacterized protein LOC107412625 isoform X2 [Ziziphus jujuba]